MKDHFLAQPYAITTQLMSAPCKWFNHCYVSKIKLRNPKFLLEKERKKEIILYYIMLLISAFNKVCQTHNERE